MHQNQKEMELYPLEEVLISPIIPFRTILESPVGSQNQYVVIYAIVLVDVYTTVNNLPHTLDDMQTISVKLKCNKQYKMVQFTESIFPTVVKALYYLLETSVINQHRNTHIEDTWLQQIHISNSENRILLYNAQGLYMIV